MKKSRIIRSLLCLVVVAMLAILPITASAVSQIYILKINTNNVKLRSGAGSNSSVVQTLKKGTKVLYLGKKGKSTCKIATTGGKVGYVNRSYLSAYGALEKNRIYKLKWDHPLYKGNGKKIGMLKAGSYVYLLNAGEESSLVRAPSGKTGYVSPNYLTKAFK